MEFKIFYFLVTVLTCISSNYAFVKSITSEDSSNWMSDNYNILGNRTLMDICILGSHDAGMSVYTEGTKFADPCNVLTQSVSIGKQLEFGARYFDLRPVLYNGEFYTGHYVKVIHVGGVGQSMTSILDEINQFISKHNEIVLVRLDKSLNLHDNRRFNSEEWEDLFQMLDTTNNLFPTDDVKIYLPSLTLDQLTNKGTKGAVLYIIKEDKVDLGSRLGKGYFYYSTNLKPYSEYSNTDSLNKMMKDQIHKMRDYSRKNYFVLAWTLTQGTTNAGFCAINMGKSILELSAEAYNKLSTIVDEVNADAFPNILYVDNINNGNFVNIVMEINKRVDLPRPLGGYNEASPRLGFNILFIFIIVYYQFSKL